MVSGEDYAFARPSLNAKKQRVLELRAGLPPRRGRKGQAAAYSLKECRRRENEITEQAEIAYRQMVAGWQPKPATGRMQRLDPARAVRDRRVGVAAANGARLSRPSKGMAARQG